MKQIIAFALASRGEYVPMGCVDHSVWKAGLIRNMAVYVRVTKDREMHTARSINKGFRPSDIRNINTAPWPT